MLSTPLRVLYLHGFASSPRSRKAQFFAERLQEMGLPVEVPDLAGGDFEHLTLSKQLGVVERAAGADPVILIGSSLGGYLAAIYAARNPKVERLVLLAPALGFHGLWTKELGPERLQSWRENGIIPIFHYGVGHDMPLAYELMQDAEQFESFPDFSQPALIFHGKQDPIVPIQQSILFAATHPNVRLQELSSGHELIDVLADIWAQAKVFLLASRLLSSCKKNVIEP
jgi:uncharacterized protein